MHTNVHRHHYSQDTYTYAHMNACSLTHTHMYARTHTHTHTTQPALSAVLYVIPSTMPSKNGKTTVISKPHMLPVNTAFTNSGYDVVTRRL